MTCHSFKYATQCFSSQYSQSDIHPNNAAMKLTPTQVYAGHSGKAHIFSQSTNLYWFNCFVNFLRNFLFSFFSFLSPPPLHRRLSTPSLILVFLLLQSASHTLRILNSDPLSTHLVSSGPRSSQTNDFQIDTCRYFLVRRSALLASDKDWLAQCQDNATEWDIS